jgi:hypothetical protein
MSDLSNPAPADADAPRSCLGATLGSYLRFAALASMTAGSVGLYAGLVAGSPLDALRYGLAGLVVPPVLLLANPWIWLILPLLAAGFVAQVLALRVSTARAWLAGALGAAALEVAAATATALGLVVAAGIAVGGRDDAASRLAALPPALWAGCVVLHGLIFVVAGRALDRRAGRH